jgi:hypothetical protein
MAERHAAHRRRADDDLAKDRRDQADDYDDYETDQDDDYEDDRDDGYEDDGYEDGRSDGHAPGAGPTARTAGRTDRPRRNGHLPPAKAAQAGLSQVAELTGKQPEGVTGVEPADDGWLVGVEVLEDRRIPSSADILAVYEVEIDPDGDLASYRRVRRYSRGRVDGNGGLSHDIRKRGVRRFGCRTVVRLAVRRVARARQPGRHPGTGARQGDRDRR